MSSEQHKFLQLKGEVNINYKVEDISRILSDNKRVKEENLEDRLREIDELESTLGMLIEENVDIRKASENRMRK